MLFLLAESLQHQTCGEVRHFRLRGIELAAFVAGFFFFPTAFFVRTGFFFAEKALGDTLNTFTLAVSTTEAALSASAWLVLTIVPAAFPTFRAILFIKSFFRATSFFRFI